MKKRESSDDAIFLEIAIGDWTITDKLRRLSYSECPLRI